MKSVKNKLIVLAFTIIAALLVFAGCASKDVSRKNKDSTSGKKTDVLRMEGGDWGASNPYLNYPRGPGGSKTNLVFDSLLDKDEKGIIPWLAEKWDIKKDGKEYIFKIRKGVKWHDGKEFTPEDVKFTFEYYKKYPPVSRDLFINGKNCVDKVDILEDKQIKITVNTVSAANLENLGVARIIPKHVWEKVTDPKKFNDKVAFIGCGPYTLKSYNKEQGSYKFEAFKDYWGPKQKVGAIEFLPVSDAVLSFEKGDIDTVNITPDLLKKYENNKEYKVIKSHNFFGYRLALNMEKMPEFKEKTVRQALAYSIDQKEIIDKVTRGAGAQASAAYLPLDHIWYNSKVKKYEFNTDKAKSLLNGKKLSFEIITSNGKEALRMAELIKMQMAKSGIDVKVKSVDMKSRDAALKSGNYQMLLTEHGGWGSDADNLREIYKSKDITQAQSVIGSIPGYKNEEIDKLCDEQMMEMDLNKRKETVYKLQEVISEEIPMISVCNTPFIQVFKPAKYDGYINTFDHNVTTHSKLTYLERK